MLPLRQSSAESNVLPNFGYEIFSMNDLRVKYSDHIKFYPNNDWQVIKTMHTKGTAINI